MLSSVYSYGIVNNLLWWCYEEMKEGSYKGEGTPLGTGEGDVSRGN
jgi:hypothetical protein